MKKTQSPPVSPALSPRARLHHKVRHEFAHTIAEYYRKHPELLNDPLIEESTKNMLALLQGVLAHIDLFDIADPPAGNGNGGNGGNGTRRS
ncbi:MAG: hypothetical protein H0W42_02920 [Gemmatimonadaceae bacterium]|nr:hypothetical protein [Gemmatimonadaceae bacterium]